MGFMALADKGDPPTLSGCNVPETWHGQDSRFLVQACSSPCPKERTWWAGFFQWHLNSGC